MAALLTFAAACSAEGGSPAADGASGRSRDGGDHGATFSGVSGRSNGESGGRGDAARTIDAATEGGRRDGGGAVLGADTRTKGGAGAGDTREGGAGEGDARDPRVGAPPAKDGGAAPNDADVGPSDVGTRPRDATFDGAPDSGSDSAPSYDPCPKATGTACAVLTLGDSITEGFGSSGGGYRVELFREAVMAGRNLTLVGSLMNGPDEVAGRPFPKRHEGHGGFTIDSGAGRSGISGSITHNTLSTYHPNIVLLMIGTNDINGNVDVANAPARLGNLIDAITTDAPKALVVVASIIPVANDPTNRKVQTYNAAIPTVVAKAAAAGKHVVFLDNYAAFSRNPNYRTALMSDYLHPNDAGYVVLGRSFYDAIGALLP